MTELRNAINNGIEYYKHSLESAGLSSSSSSNSTGTPVSGQDTPKSSLLSRILWYTLTAILVVILIVWIVYSVVDDSMKHNIKSYIENILQSIKDLFTNKKISSSAPVSPETTITPSDPSSIQPDGSLPYSPDTLQYSNIANETQAINTALNFTPPDVTQSKNTFQNDEPDSSIQGSRYESSGMWWYIDGDNGVADSSLPLPNVYTPSKNTNPL